MATTVRLGFEEFLADLRLTPTEAAVATGRIGHIREFFAKNYVLARSPWTIGSYGRETLIRWRRDIDVMVALDGSYWKTYEGDSAAFLYWIRNALDKEYSNTQVSTKKVAVRMMLKSDLQVDLVPTFPLKAGGFFMPDGRGGWQATNPPFHDDLMAKANVRCNSQLKPAVRLLKAWNALNGRHLRSFHLEMIVQDIWKDANGSLGSNAHVMSETLRCAGSRVRKSLSDPWPGSRDRLDSYLSSDQRALAARLLDEDAVRAKAALEHEANGKTAAAFERWAVVFNRKFPGYR